MRQNLKADLDAAMQKSKEQSLQHTMKYHHRPNPLSLKPPNLQQQLTCHGDLVPRLTIGNLAGTTNGQSPSQEVLSLSCLQRRASPSYRDQESSGTLRSVSPNRRAPSYDFHQDDLLSATPTRLAPTGLGRSTSQMDQAAWQEWDTWGKWGELAYSTIHYS